MPRTRSYAAGMLEYRYYALDDDGRIVSAADMEAPDDQTAVRQARVVFAAQKEPGYELWRGIFVISRSNTEPAAGPTAAGDPNTSAMG